jgi:signal transduction histidine kinase
MAFGGRPSLARDYLVFSALIISGLLLLCGLTGWTIHHHRQAQLEATLYADTQTLEYAFTGILNDVRNSANFIADKASLIGYDKKDVLARLFERTPTMDAEMQSINAWLVLDWFAKGSEASARAAAYPLPKAKAVPWQMQFADVLLERDIQEYKVLPVAFGVEDKQGKYQGAIAAKIPLDRIARVLEGALGKSRISYLILDSTLTPVASSGLSLPTSLPPEMQDLLHESFDGSPLAAKLPAPIALGNIRFTYYQKSAYPFLILSGYDQTYLASSFRQEMLPYLLLSLAMGLFFLCVLHAFRSYIITPVLHLSRVATQIRLGLRRIEVREFGPGGRQKRLYPPEIHNLRVALLRNIRDKQRDRETQHLLNEANLNLARKGMELQSMKNELERVLAVSEKSDKVKEKVIARIRYNTRNALNNIPIITQLLMRNLRGELDMHLGSEKQAQLLQIIEDQAEHIAAFTTDDLQKEKVKPAELIRECVTFHAKHAHKRGISISFKKPGKLPELWADRDRLIQIIVGLIHRSMDFLPRGGQVDIGARLEKKADRQQLIITIRDNGFGWNEEERQKALSQHDAENFSRNVDGMDLSVPSIKKLLILHNGTVTFEDVWEKGSVITIGLPYTQPGELVEPPALPENVIPLSLPREKRKD